MEESNPKGRRRRGRPRLRWLEGFEKGVQEMVVKLWRQKAMDREDWGGQGSQRAVESKST